MVAVDECNVNNDSNVDDINVSNDNENLDQWCDIKDSIGSQG